MAKLLNAAELSLELGVCVKTVQRLQRKGLPVFYVGRCARYDLEEVQRWLREQRGDRQGSTNAQTRRGRPRKPLGRLEEAQ